jgi:hypothetical protein
MQYKVPQNVDIEDKVIAGLTLRQFMFLMVAGGAVLMLKYVLVGSISFLFLPVAVLVGGFGVALAFVKINDRPFEIFLTSAAKTLITPNKRIWSKDIEIEPPHPETVKKIEEIQKKKSLGEVKSNLERLATIVDSGGAHETNVSETHMTNVRPREVEDTSRLGDVLAETEEKPAELTKIMEQAKAYVGKTNREETISSMATVQTKPTDFKYDTITLSDEKKLEEILEKTEEKQKAEEAELANAKIEKFDHQG